MAQYAWRNSLPALVERVKELHTQGHDVSSSTMKKAGREHRALYYEAAKNHRLKWSDVLAQADLVEHAKRTIGDYPWRGNLNALINRVKEIHEQQHDVSARAMQKAGGEHRALHYEAGRKHGVTWSDVLAQAGLAQHAKLTIGDYPWRKDPNSLQALLARVQELHDQHHDVSSGAMQKAGREHQALLKEARHKHGLTWSQVLHQAGLAQHAKLTIGDYPWRGNLQTLLARVKELQKENHDVSSSAMRKAGGEHYALLKEARHKHGLTWSQVLHRAGLPDLIRRENTTSTEDKVAALRRLLGRRK